MDNVEITKDEQHIKSKHRKLMFLFVIANLIFGNSVFALFVITVPAMLAAVMSTRDPFDESTQITVGVLVLLILCVIYLWFKFNSFKYIYQKAKALGESTSLYKFLNAFLYNYKVKILVLFLAVLFDCVVGALNLYIESHFGALWVPWSISNMFLIGGVTPCYIAFALIDSNIGKVFKDFILLLLFIVANIIFCCGIVPFILIMFLATKISTLISSVLMKVDINNLCLGIIFLLCYIFVKINFIRIFYAVIGRTKSVLYKFLNKFLVNIKFRVFIIIMAFLADIIMLFVQHYCVKMEDLGLITLCLINCGGVAISYLGFARFCLNKKIE